MAASATEINPPFTAYPFPSYITAQPTLTLPTATADWLPVTRNLVQYKQSALALMPQAATSTILGNISGVTAYPVALTSTQLTTLCNVFTTSLKGCAPASGGGTTNFLRADGSWAAVTSGINQLIGDVTAGPGTGSQTATLATVNSNVGSFTNANITVNGKGLITAASNGSSGGCSGITTGYALFSNGSTCTGNVNFFWENTNKTLIITGNGPTAGTDEAARFYGGNSFGTHRAVLFCNVSGTCPTDYISLGYDDANHQGIVNTPSNNAPIQINGGGGGTLYVDCSAIWLTNPGGIMSCGNFYVNSGNQTRFSVANTTGEYYVQKLTASGSAAGAGYMKFGVVAGTSAGTCKLIAYAGTSTTPTTVIDNVGGGC